MSRPIIWLFSIREHNWDECVAGPPDLEVHGEHVDRPWHGLSPRVAGIAENMQPGETALVRQSGKGVMGIWEIDEVKKVRSQDHHNWEEEYSRFIYCRALDREFQPFKDTQYFDGTDYVRFNQGANELNDDDARTFISNLLSDMGEEITSKARQRLESELAAVNGSESTEASLDASSSSEKGAIGKSITTDPIDTSGTVHEQSIETVTISEAFRQRTLARYDNRCLLTNIEGSPFVTIAHVLPRSERIAEAENPRNVVVLNWLHHQAFDAKIFTFDTDLRLRVDPEFSTQSTFLERTLVEQNGNSIEFPSDTSVKNTFLNQRNSKIDWF